MKITVATQAYNAEKYIEKCVNSVLAQTYSDLEYVLIDNGSTDGSDIIMRRLAKQDSRIKYIHYEQNGNLRWYSEILEKGEGDFFTLLDADDWLEADYLERLFNIADTTISDIVITGFFMHFEDTSEVLKRSVENRMVFDKSDFANAFPYYHVFFRAMWGKLLKTKLLRKTPLITVKDTGVTYGLDTLNVFAWLRNANRICMDNSILHHYRIHKKSISHQYDPRQSYSDLYLYNDALDFLSPYGPISEDNLFFLHKVYANAVTDTVNNIVPSALNDVQKAEEYYKILERQVTKEAYRRSCEDVANSKTTLFTAIFTAFSKLNTIPQKWTQIFSEYFPECHTMISLQSMKLLTAEKGLLTDFLNDSCEAAVKSLCALISQSKYTKQFDLAEILRSLTRNNPLLSEITDLKFLKKYGEIYLMIYQSKYGEALNAMTDILLKEKLHNETFLQLYLNIAALTESVSEFVFGKVKTAGFYLTEERFDECGEILNELSEMGVEDDKEISAIKETLNRNI